MKRNLYLILIYFLALSHIGLAQRFCHIEADTASKQFVLIQDKAATTTSRILDSDVTATVTANAERPESTVDIHLSFDASINMDDLFTVVFAIRPYCDGDCNDQTIADSWLSTKAINKATRSVDFTMGGILPGANYKLETSIFGLDGPPCSGRMISPVSFQTSAATAKPSKMLLVINEEWKNTPLVQSSLNQYIANAEKTNPLISVEKYYVSTNSTSKIGLYNYIQQQYKSDNLSYLFFIGDNASTTTSRTLLDEQGNVMLTAGSYSFTHYTLPLYQHYTYDPSTYYLQNVKYQNTCYRPDQEIREAVFQQHNSLISMGMIIPDPALSFDGQINYLGDYFAKLHKFKNKEITFEKKVLLTDGFVSEQNAVAKALTNGRWIAADVLSFGRTKDTDYSGEDLVWKTDFLDKLSTRSYELFSLNLHGSPTYHSFGIYSSDITYNLPKANTQLINLLSCNVGHYKYNNYLAGLYLQKGNVMNVHAYSDLLVTITINGASALESQFLDNGAYTLMSRGFNTSDAFRLSGSYNESELILGDPLNKLQDIPSPITFENFEVNKEGRTAILNWSAFTKIYFSHFEIERSGDEKTWVNLGSVLASNQHSSNAQYSFLDKKPLNGDNFYRLKLIDLDGNYSYSDTRQVSFDFFSYIVYPNPTSDKIYLSGGLLENAKSIDITNQSGITLFESSGVMKDGIPTNKLSDGLYIIRVKMTDESVRTLKIVVSR